MDLGIQDQGQAWQFLFIPGILLLEDTHLKDHDSYSEIMDVVFNILGKLIAIFNFYYALFTTCSKFILVYTLEYTHLKELIAKFYID